MRKIKKNIASIIFSKYSKYMDKLLEPNKNTTKDKQNSEFSEGGMYVREDDQDWGSAGMNDIQQDSDIN
jgi:hypothetical protein